MKTENYFRLGTLIKTRGVKGELQLHVDSGNAENYEELKQVFIEINKKLVPYFVNEMQVQNNAAYLYLDEVDTIEKAAALLRKYVYLPLEMKVEVEEEDELTPYQLAGYEVVDSRHGPLGTIKEVVELPQQLIAVVIHQEKEVLFPLHPNTIMQIDHVKKILAVDLPEGLLDVYLE